MSERLLKLGQIGADGQIIVCEEGGDARQGGGCHGGEEEGGDFRAEKFGGWIFGVFRNEHE